MKLIAEGAEARIFQSDSKIVKERIPKVYRIKQIDSKIRAFRTKREVKVMDALGKAGIPVPKLISSDDCKIVMQHIPGEKIVDVLNKKNLSVICREIGFSVGKMHSAGIIHSDLTTSNMILSGGKIYYIDFGLSFFSTKVEDKAVDIHLFRQTIESKHNGIWKKCFQSFLKGYEQASADYKEVLNRLEKVEARGRNKAKG